MSRREGPPWSPRGGGHEREQAQPAEDPRLVGSKKQQQLSAIYAQLHRGRRERARGCRGIPTTTRRHHVTVANAATRSHAAGRTQRAAKEEKCAAMHDGRQRRMTRNEIQRGRARSSRHSNGMRRQLALSLGKRLRRCLRSPPLLLSPLLVVLLLDDDDVVVVVASCCLLQLLCGGCRCLPRSRELRLE